MTVVDLGTSQFSISDLDLRRLFRLIDELCAKHRFTAEGEAGYSEMLFFAKQSRFLDTLRSAERLVDLSRNVDAQLLAAAILTTFFCSGHRTQEVLSEADLMLSEVVKLSPGDARIFYWSGVLAKNVNVEVAKACFERAIQLDPNEFHARIEYSRILVHIEKRVDEGLDQFDEALKLNPDYIEAYPETSFYELYLSGPISPRLLKHIDSETEQKRILAKRQQIDRLPIRFLAGISPFIGHYGYLDTFVKLIKLNWIPNIQLAILAQQGEVVNPSLMSYFSEFIKVYSHPVPYKLFSPISSVLEFDYKEIPGFATTFKGDYWRMAAAVQDEWEKTTLEPALTISSDHSDRARAELEKVGIPRDAWFVSLHVRDDGFKGPDHHHALRNSSVADYCDAIRAITDRGGWVIRMGDPKMVPLPEMPGVFDYARSPLKSDWMDVFLWSSCKFFVGGNSGPSWIPHCFGVPVVRVNWTPITRVPWTGADIMICKRFEDVQSGRALSFREMIDPEGQVSWTHDSAAITKRGLRCCDNTPDEIRSAVLEMLEQTDRSDIRIVSDERLQDRLDKIVLEVSGGARQGDRVPRFSSYFLAKHQYALE